MVTLFNDLRVIRGGDSLLVECSVNPARIFSGMYIKSIHVDWYGSWPTQGDWSAHAVTLYENVDDDPEVRSFRGCLDASDLPSDFGASTFRDGLFYVTVRCGGTPDPSIGAMPCGWDRDTDIGIVPDWGMLYRLGMPYVRQLSGCGGKCGDAKPFLAFTIIWNAFRLAAGAGDWETAAGIWRKAVRMASARPGQAADGCGCGK